MAKALAEVPRCQPAFDWLREVQEQAKDEDPDHGTLKKSQMELLLPLLRALCFKRQP